MLFNAQIHGYKLLSLYYRCMNHRNLVILIKTTKDEVFGAFVSTIGHEQHWKNFLNDNEAFVFLLKSNDSENGQRKIYCSGHVSSVLPTRRSLSVGYDRCNLIFIDDALEHGFSEECEQINCSSLCGEDDGQFDIYNVEIWSVEDEFEAAVHKKDSIHSLCEDYNLHKLSNVLFGGRQHSHTQYSSISF